MTVIDKKTGISYEHCNRVQTAMIVGVSAMTIWRWKKRLEKEKIQVETYNRYEIYFETEMLKRGCHNIK